MPTLVGEVSRPRPYCDCSSCQQGSALLDDALQLSTRRTQWDVPQAAARLAAEVPLQTAQERFPQRTGLSAREQAMQAVAGELRHELGVLAGSPSTAAIGRRVAEMAADVGCSLGDQERIVHPGRGDQGSGAAEVDAALRPGQSLEEQVRVCGLGDGATWIWPQVTALLPPAVQLLDADHGGAHVHPVGARQCHEAAVHEREGVEARLARLFWGEVAGASAGWEALPPRDAPTAESSRTRLGLLRNNAGWRHDRTARKGGCPLGSGGLEAANPRLALCCAIYNGTFARVFEADTRRALQRHGRNPP